MRLQEHQGKALFERVGIPVPPGRLARTPQEAEGIARKLGGPVVVKAQVLVGGRGKAGGVRRAETPEQARQHAQAILGMDLKGERVTRVLVTQAVEIRREFYLAIVVDRSRKQPILIFSTEGGVDIEEVARARPEAVVRVPLDPLLGLQPYQVRSLLYQSGVEAALFEPLSALIEKLYRAFTRFEAHLVEINPLALTPDGRLLAVDAKFIVDDEALFRLPQLRPYAAEAADQDPQERAAQEAGLQYVKLDGDIGVIGNGAGLVMATLDVVRLAGGRPANFLDIGGGADAAQMRKALEIVLADPQVRGVFVNIFGGITRCDEVAKGLIAARDALDVRLPMVVRLTGTNEGEGRALLESHRIMPVAGMEAGAEQIVAAVGAAQAHARV